jgi:hypothetical protein
MKNDINSKSSPNQMRILMQRMRDGKFVANEGTAPKKDLSMRDMLKITRNPLKLNEDIENNPQDNTPVEPQDGEKEATSANKETAYDQSEEEEKFRNYFDDINVDIKFIPLKIYDNLVFWGGVIDGVIEFVYKVTPDEKSTGIEFNYTPDFTADNPDNDLIIKKIESYFDIFYKYWRNNILQA